MGSEMCIRDRNTSQSENKDNPDVKVESKDKQPVASADTSTAGKNGTETKENTES